MECEQYIVRYAEKWEPNFIVTLELSVMFQENNCKADCSTQTRNTTVQSQAKQTLSNMRTNIVRSCKSIKKKVEKLRDKLNCDCDDKANNDIDSKQVTSLNTFHSDSEKNQIDRSGRTM